MIWPSAIDHIDLSVSDPGRPIYITDPDGDDTESTSNLADPGQ